ncbi:MAG TPA: nuclear transport factor 2 family protein [Mycobacterium sp.]|nr:nuclear transport factor 2 family protein [Mycobacterium sp.]HTX98094.1 nuclear transport factor 2 family protein [Mycobacterium sp.]
MGFRRRSVAPIHKSLRQPLAPIFPPETQTLIAKGERRMTVQEVIDSYYDCVNRGDWQQWLTLFSDEVVGDEQLAGHFDGISVLRGAIDGIRSGYKVFQMHPQHMVIDGDAAVVVWHFEGQNSHGVPIAYPGDANREVIGANYFQVEGGQIVYMRTIHDSLPFQPFLDQRQQ